MTKLQFPISPEIEAISSLQPDYHGGNMDLPDVAPGMVLYFPVRRSEIHDGGVNFEKVPDFINHRQPRGGLGL